MARKPKDALVKETPQLEDTAPALPEGVAQTESENTVAEGLRQPKKRYPGNWIKATPEEVQAYTEQGRLFGYDPDNGEVLIDVKK